MELSGADAEKDRALRAKAISRLRQRRDFRLHVSIYIAVNTVLVLVWASTGGPFWPVFPILGWGLGVSINAWCVYGRSAIGEEAIQREVARLRDGRAG